ncbi:MAG: polysaccharide deacetylase family protein [Oscillospiraceae bacterium]|nr:polysaccharide deacetylase family protein [Oscillospiraceae bacterium]
MQKRALCGWLIFCLLLGAGALAEEAPMPTEEAQTLAGFWSLSEVLGWQYVLENDEPLSAEGQAAAEAYGLTVRGGALPAGSSLSEAQLLSVFADWTGAALPTPPVILPDLQFSKLNGEWYEEADGTLMYRPGGYYQPLTVEQVFAALDTGDHGQPDTPVEPNGKTIYFTVDDAPRHSTMELLAMLHNLDVPATFFVVGKYVRQYPMFLRAIYNQGHVLANHSYTHSATSLNESYRNCLNDFQRCETAVAEALGFELPMPLLRVPYGSSTISSYFRKRLREDGYSYIDWNALNGDAEEGIDTNKKMLQKAYYTVDACEGDVVFLVHDAKRRTINTLPEMVKHFREQGYVFGVLTPELGGVEGVRSGWAYSE